MACVGLGSTYGHSCKMLGAFDALELLTAKPGVTGLTTCPAQHNHAAWLFILSLP